MAPRPGTHPRSQAPLLWLLLALTLPLLAACGGAQTSTNTAGGPTTGGKPAAAGDVAFDVGPTEIKGVVFQPNALDRPPMATTGGRKKTTLEKQRAAFQKAKDPVVKQAEASILASMLYLESKTNKTGEQAMWTEGRQVLRDALAAAGPKPDEITLRMLGSYEYLFDDYAGAADSIPDEDGSYVVVMTLGYASDKVVIKQLVDRDVKYFGVLGSKAKMATLMKELKNEGIDSDRLARIRTPIGIPINSRTPEEIAISIAAEIIAVKNGAKAISPRSPRAVRNK